MPVLVCLSSGRLIMRGEVAHSQYLQLSNKEVKSISSTNLALILIYLRSRALCVRSVMLAHTKITVFARLRSLSQSTYLYLFVRCFKQVFIWWLKWTIKGFIDLYNCVFDLFLWRKRFLRGWLFLWGLHLLEKGRCRCSWARVNTVPWVIFDNFSRPALRAFLRFSLNAFLLSNL